MCSKFVEYSTASNIRQIFFATKWKNLRIFEGFEYSTNFFCHKIKKTSNIRRRRIFDEFRRISSFQSHFTKIEYSIRIFDRSNIRRILKTIFFPSCHQAMSHQRLHFLKKKTYRIKKRKFVREMSSQENGSNKSDEEIVITLVSLTQYLGLKNCEGKVENPCDFSLAIFPSLEFYSDMVKLAELITNENVRLAKNIYDHLWPFMTI